MLKSKIISYVGQIFLGVYIGMLMPQFFNSRFLGNDDEELKRRTNIKQGYEHAVREMQKSGDYTYARPVDIDIVKNYMPENVDLYPEFPNDIDVLIPYAVVVGADKGIFAFDDKGECQKAFAKTACWQAEDFSEKTKGLFIPERPHLMGIMNNLEDSEPIIFFVFKMASGKGSGSGDQYLAVFKHSDKFDFERLYQAGLQNKYEEKYKNGASSPVNMDVIRPNSPAIYSNSG